MTTQTHVFGLTPEDHCIVYGKLSQETRLHERHVAAEYTWPALPPHLRAMPDARAMVRHWVRTNYHWEP